MVQPLEAASVPDVATVNVRTCPDAVIESVALPELQDMLPAAMDATVCATAYDAGNVMLILSVTTKARTISVVNVRFPVLPDVGVAFTTDAFGSAAVMVVPATVALSMAVPLFCVVARVYVPVVPEMFGLTIVGNVQEIAAGAPVVLPVPSRVNVKT